MPHMPENAKKLFKITEEELDRLHKLMENMEPRETTTSASLHGNDKARRFKYADLMKKGINTAGSELYRFSKSITWNR